MTIIVFYSRVKTYLETDASRARCFPEIAICMSVVCFRALGKYLFNLHIFQLARIESATACFKIGRTGVNFLNIYYF